ncbi:unnamed protein product [Strongylus vulgaris]|uniref:WASH complex subunit 7 central domain-containing protein n=1 Tax=Strongylus vulgaris TaxID=40348 RepID=A0A3P7J1H8_STRVU|nr:unnamed protein product [Strongylus vulgaris]
MSEPEFRLHGIVLNAAAYYPNFQLFIEKLSPNRSLRVLTSEHMADSMRTHGLGVLNTSVNVTYQLFIEKLSPNRSLRVLTSEHMADSMRTHGLGVLNTSVNVTYQLLRSKFAVFNQLLKDEHIHAQLQKDIRHFHENLETLKKLVGILFLAQLAII